MDPSSASWAVVPLWRKEHVSFLVVTLILLVHACQNPRSLLQPATLLEPVTEGNLRPVWGILDGHWNLWQTEILVAKGLEMLRQNATCLCCFSTCLWAPPETLSSSKRLNQNQLTAAAKLHTEYSIYRQRVLQRRHVRIFRNVKQRRKKTSSNDTISFGKSTSRRAINWELKHHDFCW